jgi:hypothetical protein
MNSQDKGLFLLLFVLLISSCAGPAETVSPTVVPSSPTQAGTPTTRTSTEIPEDVPVNSDTALFGAITQGEIQTYSLEPVANAIFTRAMNAIIANGDILEYQVTRVAVFPTGDGSLYAEITFNVRTTDIIWLEDNGTQADDNWINDKCNRFDFVTTETEFQLKNKRTCN